ncbi:hypothetical protein [Xenorhabdus sp. TH1]|uniref:hypothetical protein n=1 Tax=Xenorhabdus sp. TH1 TaxID=3130166 RepID=UPI0030CB83AF
MFLMMKYKAETAFSFLETNSDNPEKYLTLVIAACNSAFSALDGVAISDKHCLISLYCALIALK